jgi:helix-turn-helix protein
MSVQAISWVIEKSQHSLGSLLVLFMIANHAKSDGTGAWPSVSTLAKEARLSERQVRYCLRKLERSGELQTQIKAGPYGTNTYSLPCMVGANIAPPGAVSDMRRGNLRQQEGQSSAPEPSLTVSKDKEAILLAIEESERTGEPADEILARKRGYLQ